MQPFGSDNLWLGKGSLPQCGENATAGFGVAILRRWKDANVASRRHAAKLVRTEMSDGCVRQDKCRRFDRLMTDRLSYTDVE